MNALQVWVLSLGFGCVAGAAKGTWRMSGILFAAARSQYASTMAATVVGGSFFRLSICDATHVELKYAPVYPSDKTALHCAHALAGKRA